MSGKNPLGNGKEPQSYEGLNIIVPVGGWRLVKAARAPTSNDTKYPIGTLWINTATNTVYCLTSTPANWQVLESSAGGVLPVSEGGTGLATITAHGVILGEGTGNVATVAPVAVGSVLASQGTSSDPAFVAITELNFVDVASSSQAMAVSTSYITDNGASLVTYTLPSTVAQGQRLVVVGKSSGGWKIAQNAGQTIHFNSSNTTTGVTGSLASTNQYNCVELICTTANTDFVVRNSSGTLTVT